jgi:hypothetical protein
MFTWRSTVRQQQGRLCFAERLYLTTLDCTPDIVKWSGMEWNGIRLETIVGSSTSSLGFNLHTDSRNGLIQTLDFPPKQPTRNLIVSTFRYCVNSVEPNECYNMLFAFHGVRDLISSYDSPRIHRAPSLQGDIYRHHLVILLKGRPTGSATLMAHMRGA